MGEQREQPREERTEVTGDLADAELEQASGGAWYMKFDGIDGESQVVDSQGVLRRTT